MKQTVKLCVLLCAVGFAGNRIGRWQERAEASPELVTTLGGEVDPELTARVVEKYGEAFATAAYPAWVDLNAEQSTEPDIVFDWSDEGVPPCAYIEWGAAEYCLIMIVLENGDELRMDFSGDTIDIKGNADMNEAAKVFFNDSLKTVVDDYIKERINQ